MSCSTAQDLLLKNGGSANNVRWAGATIVRCGDAAPSTLIKAIRTVPLNSLRDSVVERAAWILADRRLVDSVIALGKDPQQSINRRTLALKLLTRYSIHSASLIPEAVNDHPPIVIATVEHSEAVAGNVPLDDAASGRALEAMRWISLNDSDAGVRTLAGLAVKQLATRLGS
jgi:hypothetical protein